jgi:hypothetical protein
MYWMYCEFCYSLDSKYVVLAKPMPILWLPSASGAQVCFINLVLC